MNNLNSLDVSVRGNVFLKFVWAFLFQLGWECLSCVKTQAVSGPPQKINSSRADTVQALGTPGAHKCFGEDGVEPVRAHNLKKGNGMLSHKEAWPRSQAWRWKRAGETHHFYHQRFLDFRILLRDCRPMLSSALCFCMCSSSPWSSLLLGNLMAVSWHAPWTQPSCV